jgi:hypothetical protein
VGRWLSAAALSRPDVVEDLGELLPRGVAGFRDDEAAVAEAACELAARRYFGADYDVRAVTVFARWLRDVWVGGWPLDVMQLEAVIRAALGEREIDLSGITPPELRKAQCVAASYICKVLEMDETAVDAMFAEAEAVAAGQGWKPLLADDGEV